MASKRKAESQPHGSPPAKRSVHETHGFDHTRPEENHGVVIRKYYPAEMSNERCAQYITGELPKPLKVLESTLEDTRNSRAKITAGKAVVHWFKRDLRLQDNLPLKTASDLAQKHKIPLICVYLLSPQDLEAHLTSPARVDFELRTLAIMKEDLRQLDIPLYVDTIEKRKELPKTLIKLCKEWGAHHIFCGMEYEVDELRRENALVQQCLAEGIDFSVVHDDVVVRPGALSTGAGKQFSIFSPWFRAWISHLHSHASVLDPVGPPEKNSKLDASYKTIFDRTIPSAPNNKALSDKDRKRMADLWPAGEHEAHDRLDSFLSNTVGRYKNTRNFPAANSTAMLSVHFSTGTLSAKAAIRKARDSNTTKKLDGGNAGVSGWIMEVAWRDFYKHVLAGWPYICMNKPFKYEYTDIEWEYNDEHFQLWCQGKTGYPIGMLILFTDAVDAAMRQLNSMGYMHNRCRMITASFLSKHLLADWRMGERYFMEHLIDGDFASNNGGWGFSSSVGTDANPYFRIFNPLLQSEKFDNDGDYIRKWIPELAGIQGSAVHDPYGRGASKQAEKAGYPKPVVEHKMARARALERYKKGLKRDTA